MGDFKLDPRVVPRRWPLSKFRRGGDVPHGENDESDELCSHTSYSAADCELSVNESTAYIIEAVLN